MKKWLRHLVAAAALLLPSIAAAQNVTVIGPVTPGHCTSFFSTTQVQDSGIGCGGGGGGVTSVGLALPASTFNVSGSPVTGGGTLTGSFTNQAINVVFAGPASGGAAVPTWRALVANDLAGALASPPPIGTTTPAQGAFAALSATGNLTVTGNIISNITGSTQCVHANSGGILSGTGSDCGSGGGGAVSSVSNADSTLTVSPTTGAVVASLNLAHINTWTVTQNFAGLTATSITDSGISGSTQCVQANSSGVLSGFGSGCGGAVTSVTNADGTLTISPTTGAVVASLALGHANTWTAAQTFNNSDIILKGSSTGATTFTSANAGASNFTATVPANTGTIAELNLAQTWSAVQTHNSGDLVLAGATSGTLTVNCAATCGANTLTFPAGTTDFSSTGGAKQYVKQASAGGAFTVGTIAAADITPAGSNTQVQYNNSGAFGAAAGFTFDGTSVITLGVAGTSVGGVKLTNVTSGSITLNPATGALGAVTATFPANTGTVAELNLAQTFSAQQTFSSTLVFSGLSAGTQTKCLGLDVSNNVVYVASACGSGGGTPGGANTNVQFNNSSAFGGDAGFTYLGNGQATLALGTITTNLKALSITATWNAVGTTFDAPLFVNVTNTASATTSLLMDLQIGGATQFAVARDGTIILAPGGETFPIANLPTNGIGITNRNPGVLSVEAPSGTRLLQVVPTGGLGTPEILIPALADFTWNEGTVLWGSPSNVLTLANGASAQAFRVYNTVDTATSPTNYERAAFDWTTTANTLTIGSQAGGTGTARTVMLVRAALYSAAGIALPTCVTGLKGAQTVVSDATSPTYNGTYSSGGAVVALVVCNGTNWVTQ